MTKFSSFFSEADVEKMTYRTSFGRCGIGDEIRRHVVYCRSEQVPLTSTTNLLCPLGDERPADWLEVTPGGDNRHHAILHSIAGIDAVVEPYAMADRQIGR